jgi:hypothetical protein
MPYRKLHGEDTKFKNGDKNSKNIHEVDVSHLRRVDRLVDANIRDIIPG